MPEPPPDGRFFIAFDDLMWEWDPAWTRIDGYPNLVTSYTIDRGRQFELDRTDTGRALVQIADVDGILDPTNPGSPFYGKIEPLLQAMIGRRDPITGEWFTRFRGVIEEYSYAFDPSQKVNRLSVSLVDIFEALAAIDMVAGAFGDPVPGKIESAEVVFFDDVDIVRDRMAQVLGNAGIPPDFIVLFTGNVSLFETSYSQGESVMDVLTDCADAEFPGVGNLYVDRFGRFCFHGRLSKFDPETVSEGANWDWHQWFAGDGHAVALNPADTAHIRRFAFDRGLSKVINSATCTPMWASARSTATTLAEPTVAELRGQLVTDDASIELRGMRSWSAMNLQTEGSTHDASGSLAETKRFASFYVANYSTPRNRVSEIGFRSISPAHPAAAATWAFLSQVDISDAVNVSVDSPGGGGFYNEAFFVEGIHEEVAALTPDYDDVTLTLDLSPRAYFEVDPWR